MLNETFSVIFKHRANQNILVLNIYFFSICKDEVQTITTQSCTVQSEYARSLNGTYTFTLIDFQIDNEEIFHLDFRIKGVKEDVQSRNVFRHKTFSELKS